MPLTDDEFDAVFADTYRPLLRYARRRVGDVERAEMVVSEVYVEAWAAPARRRKVSLPLLYRLAYSKIVEHDRRSDMHVRLSPPLGRSESGVDPISDLDRTVLVDALNALRPREREAVLLTYWEEVTASELAVALGCRERRARAILARALGRLTRRLAREFPTPLRVEGMPRAVAEY